MDLNTQEGYQEISVKGKQPPGEELWFIFCNVSILVTNTNIRDYFKNGFKSMKFIINSELMCRPFYKFQIKIKLKKQSSVRLGLKTLKQVKIIMIDILILWQVFHHP